jgi:hypothetical protein
MDLEGGRRFEAKKPLLGRARGGVVVDDGMMRIEHPLLKAPVVVPIEQIAAVVEPAGTEADPLLLRDVRILGLVSGGLASPNLIVVFRWPVRIERFRLGAERVMAISGRERRRGVDVDALGVEVQDPYGLREALRARGATPAMSLATALVSVVGEAHGPIADERRREVQRAGRRQRLLGFLVGVVAAALLSAQASFALSGEPEAALIARMVVAAVAGAIATGAVGSVVLGAVARRKKVHSASAGAALLGLSAMAALAVLVVARIQMDRWLGAPFVIAHAALGAASGGWVLALSFRDDADPAPPPGPFAAEPRAQMPFRALAGALALATVAVIASREPSVTGDLAIARAAIVAADDLPSGWVSCCVSRAYRGSALDEHICGSAGLPPHTAGFERQFALNLADDRSEGSIVEAVFLAPTADAARREFAATDAPGYAACAEASVERRARSIISDATGEPQTTSTRSRLPDGAPGIVDRFTTTVPVPGGRDVVFTAFVRMQTGRAIVRMPIITYAAPLNDEELALIVGPAARTLERALRGGPP